MRKGTFKCRSGLRNVWDPPLRSSGGRLSPSGLTKAYLPLLRVNKKCKYKISRIYTTRVRPEGVQRYYPVPTAEVPRWSYSSGRVLRDIVFSHCLRPSLPTLHRSYFDRFFETRLRWFRIRHYNQRRFLENSITSLNLV